MPLYEYECTRCANRFELIQKFSDPPTTPCPACGATAERLLSPPAIQFKGSGWYVTDYARKAAPAEKGEGESKPTEGKKEKKEKKSPTPTTKQSDG